MFAPMCSAEKENKIVVQEWHKQGLVAALTDPNPRTVAAALTDQRNLPLIPATLKTLDEGARQKLVPALEKLLTVGNASVVRDAAQALGQLGAKDKAVPALEKLLTVNDANIVWDAAQALTNFQPIKLNTALLLLHRCYGNVDEIGQLRFYAHFLSGGVKENEIAIACLGKNDPASCELASLKAEAAHEHLQTFRTVWDASETFGDLRKDLADKIGKLAIAGNWSAEDLAQIKDLKQLFEKHGGSYTSEANMLSAAINASDRGWWVKRLGYGWIAHALFWLALIFVYPRSPQVQAIFFWNKWV